MRPGYKQTEVGVIPEDWEIVKLGKYATFKTGPFGSALHQSDYVDGGVPVINPMQIVGGKIQPTPSMAITEQAARNLSEFRLSAGNVVIGRRGEMGRCAFVRTEEHGWLCGTGSMIIRTGPSLDARFIQRVLSSPPIIAEIENASVGSTMINLNQGTLGNLHVPLPPTKAEQEAIAEALSDADGLIESLEQLLAKKRLLKQGAMQELLTGKRRLPGFSGEWEVKRLGELADIRSGGTPSTMQPQFWDGDILWCTPTDITSLNGFKYLQDTSRKISHQGLKNSSAEMIPVNSIVMTSRATIGECAINTVPVSTNQGFKNFIPFEHFDVEFLYYLLLTQKQGFISLCGGSTFLEIGKTQLAAFEVKLPAEKAEQTAIAAILSDMDGEIGALEAKLAKARRIKQAMMQELLTGRIRLVQSTARIIPLPTQKQTSPATAKSHKSHNWQINEAVIIGVLAKHFGSEKFPLARKRCTKLTYLLHRHVERQAEGYLKKAAGPYNPAVKYKGPEGIAQKNGYVRPHHNGTYPGFVAAGNITEAEAYFAQWYGPEVLPWLEQFRFKKTDELELLTTVDMAMEDLRREGQAVNLGAVKQVIHDHPEWEAKLEREIFADPNIIRAIDECREFLGN